jgi:hypothetical protein
MMIDFNSSIWRNQPEYKMRIFYESYGFFFTRDEYKDMSEGKFDFSKHLSDRVRFRTPIQEDKED